MAASKLRSAPSKELRQNENLNGRLVTNPRTEAPTRSAALISSLRIRTEGIQKEVTKVRCRIEFYIIAGLIPVASMTP